MIGVMGYFCLDVCPDLGQAPFEYVPGMLREVGAAPGFPGGVVGNTGGALCRLQLPSRLGGLVGQDVFGVAVRDALRQTVASGELIFKEVPGESTAYSLVLNPADSDRMFLVCRGVNDCIKADSFDDSFFEGLKILHFGYPSLCKAMALNDGRETRCLFERCHAKGILTSLDLSLPSPGTIFYDLDWMAFLKNVLPETDVFCPSIDEIRFMMKDLQISPKAIAERMIALGAKVVFLKMGKDGMLVKTADTDGVEKTMAAFGTGKWRNVCKEIPPFPVKVVGTTGAGDSSIAGFLAGIYMGFDAETSERLAARVAAYSISAVDSLSGIPPMKTILEKRDW